MNDENSRLDKQRQDEMMAQKPQMAMQVESSNQN
jgi:hypothetical protein